MPTQPASNNAKNNTEATIAFFFIHLLYKNVKKLPYYFSKFKIDNQIQKQI